MTLMTRASYPRSGKDVLEQYRLSSLSISFEQLETTKFASEDRTFINGQLSATAKRSGLAVTVSHTWLKAEQLLRVMAEVLDELEERT